MRQRGKITMCRGGGMVDALDLKSSSRFGSESSSLSRGTKLLTSSYIYCSFKVMKKCSKCNKILRDKDFNWHKTDVKRSSYCKDCSGKIVRSHYQKHRAKKFESIVFTPVAQRIRHLSSEQEIGGSIPSGRAKLFFFGAHSSIGRATGS